MRAACGRRGLGVIDIVHEDEALLVAVKPAGLPTLGAAGPNSPSLESEIAARYPQTEDIPDHGIAHRLDNDTSGLVCVGLNPDAYEHLRAQRNSPTARPSNATPRSSWGYRRTATPSTRPSRTIRARKGR